MTAFKATEPLPTPQQPVSQPPTRAEYLAMMAEIIRRRNFSRTLCRHSESRHSHHPTTSRTDKNTAARPQLEKIQVALKARHDEETRKMLERQEQERTHETEIYNLSIVEKRDNLRAMQKAELDRFNRNPAEYSDDWIRKMYEVMQQKWNPNAAERQRLAKEQQLEALKTRQRLARETAYENMKMKQEQAIDDLKDRHAQQLREQAAKQQKELARYTKEHEAAQRLLAETADEQ